MVIIALIERFNYFCALLMRITQTEMKKIRMIINPISGRGSKDTIPERAREVLAGEEYALEIFQTEYAGHASILTKEAIAMGTDIILAVGGDGTINEVARAMLHTEATLGIIPVGSGNGLARELSIPLEVQKALEVVKTGKTIAIDYCKANDEVFFCTCGIGFDASVSMRFSKEKHRGPIVYAKTAITEYFRFRPEMCEIIMGDEVISGKTFLVACGNASQYGNNAFIAPNASIQDGYFDVSVLKPINPLDVGPVVVQLFTKQLKKNHKFEAYRTQNMIIRREKPGVMHIDGEPIIMDREIHIQSFPQGLNVLIPTNPMPLVYDMPSFFHYVSRWLTDIKNAQFKGNS